MMSGASEGDRARFAVDEPAGEQEGGGDCGVACVRGAVEGRDGVDVDGTGGTRVLAEDVGEDEEAEFGGEEGEEWGLELGVGGGGGDEGEGAADGAGAALTGVALFWSCFTLWHVGCCVHSGFGVNMVSLSLGVFEGRNLETC